MVQLELGDIQGLIARGYGNLPAACYLVLQVEDAPVARAWLRAWTERVTPGDRKPDDLAFHMAFTCHGLRALGLDEETLATFSWEFWEGMADEHRARHVLGDRDASAPEKWRWGGADTHVLLLLFARDSATLEGFYAQVRAGYRGVAERQRLDTYSFETVREHFGFNDGIAQPFVDGLSRRGPADNTVAAGEFILGYGNAYDKLPLSPTVAAGRDPRGILDRVQTEAGDEAGDLGGNGSYLVFRQLSQDVQAFWRFVDEATRLSDGTSDPEARLLMAAKMVGRWPSGAPLTLCPERDDPTHTNRDDFGYRRLDEHGYFCPKGAHIRRTNPRDALEGSLEDSIKVSNRHRVLRRGRPYGAPISRQLDVDELLRAEQAQDEVGLHFICLNTDIGRQFEFIQHTWINNAKFAGLYSDADPLMGHHEMGHHERLQNAFTLQGAPLRRRVTGLQKFVEMRGGAYFFLPGMRALRFLGSMQV